MQIAMVRNGNLFKLSELIEWSELDLHEICEQSKPWDEGLERTFLTPCMKR